MLRVGSLTIDPPVLLAPMAEVTDLPFRTLCEEHGVGLTITEFLSAHALVQGAPKALGKMTASLGGRPFGVQIFGREEEPLARAAELAVAGGASIVDINMGCPSKRVVAGACGSALMREPELAQRLVRAVRACVPADVPVSVKHRAGWDERHLNGPEFAVAMVEAGAQMITVHGRTRAQGFTGEASPEIIRQVREAVPRGIPVVGNGDVRSVEDDARMRAQTGCDAVMIGRGLIGNPWLVRAITARLAGWPDPGPPSVGERLTVFARHLELMRAHTPERRLVHEIRKACAWYTKRFPGCAAFRERTQHLTDTAALVAEARAFFERQLLREAA